MNKLIQIYKIIIPVIRPMYKRKIYKHTAKQILDIISNYDNSNILDYLKEIIYNLSLQV